MRRDNKEEKLHTRITPWWVDLEHPFRMEQLTSIKHGVSFISFPPTDLSSQTQRGGNYLFLTETSAQFVCASHVKKAMPLRDTKSSSQRFLWGSKSALDQATVEGRII
jgi:hypothetical protein